MGEDIQLRNAILNILRERNEEVSLEELLESLPGYGAMDIKSAVWPLMSEHAIELTPQRNLRALALVNSAGAH